MVYNPKKLAVLRFPWYSAEVEDLWGRGFVLQELVNTVVADSLIVADELLWLP